MVWDLDFVHPQCVVPRFEIDFATIHSMGLVRDKWVPGVHTIQFPLFIYFTCLGHLWSAAIRRALPGGAGGCRLAGDLCEHLRGGPAMVKCLLKSTHKNGRGGVCHGHLESICRNQEP